MQDDRMAKAPPWVARASPHSSPSEAAAAALAAAADVVK